MTFILTSLFFLIVTAVATAIFYAVRHTYIRDEYKRDEQEAALVGLFRTSITAFVIGALILVGGNILFRSAMQVDPGQGGVLVWFGRTQSEAVPSGFHFVNPMADRYKMSVMRRTIDFTDDKSEGNAVNPVNGPAVLVTTADHNLLRLSVSIPYALRLEYLPALFENVGRTNDLIETKLLETNVRSALVDTAPQFTWRQIMAKGRGEVLKKLHENITQAIARDLANYGVDSKIAKDVLVVSMPQIRQVTPSDKVKSAIDEAAATKVLKDRQADLNDIARAKVERRELEGQAIEQMFAKLPKGATSMDIQRVMNATAAKQRADALMKAVEQDKVKIIFMGGGSAHPALTMPNVK